MPTKTVDQYEREYLLAALGGLALPTDTLQDLRYKFYKGSVEGSIASGGGGGPLKGTFDGTNYQYSLPGVLVGGRIDGDIFSKGNSYEFHYFEVGKAIRLRRLARDFYGLTGTPTGAVRYAIYNADSQVDVGSLVGSLATLTIAAGWQTNVVDRTLQPGGYFLVNHNDFSGLTALFARQYWTPNVIMASEQSVVGMGLSGAWPGNWPASLSPAIVPLGIGNGTAQVVNNYATALLGWDMA